MTPERWARISQLLEESLSLPKDRRHAYLSTACGADDELVRTVERMLVLAERAAGFLERPILSTLTLGPASRTVTPTLSPGAELAERFRVVRFIASGGMGEVYEAEDLVLGGPVALKTIRSDLSLDETTARLFHQEVQAAKRISHRNICRIHDLHMNRGADPAASITFLTMELIQGVTLAERLQRVRRLRPGEALAIAEQLAAALSEAHVAGIAHGDFKSGNILLASSAGAVRAVVTDFGLARAFFDERHSLVISQAPVLGTPAYMAPEQFRGAPVSAAVDIYAFGVVLYESVTGKLPFNGTLHELADKKLYSDPRPPREIVPDLPAVWDAVIMKCLARRPEDRFEYASDVADALSPRELPQATQPAQAASARALPRSGSALRRTIWAAAALIALLVLAVVGYTRLGPGLPSEKRLVILPFDYIGSDKETQAFSQGLLETATSMLSELPSTRESLYITPSSEVRSEAVKTVAEAKRNFGANLVLTGSIQKAGAGLIVTMNLVNAAANRQLRSRVLTVEAGELASVQQRVAMEMSELLAVELGTKERNMLARAHAANAAANRAYLQGSGFLQQIDIPGRLEAAIGNLNTAVQLDPEFPDAAAALSRAYAEQYKDTRDAAVLMKARAWSAKALALAPEAPVAEAAAGAVDLLSGNLESARAHFKAVLVADPFNADAYDGIAECDEQSGMMADAEHRYRDAIKLRPGDWWFRSQLAVFYVNRGRYRDAAAAFEEVRKLSPDNPLVLRNLGGVYMGLGEWDRAEQDLRRSIQIAPTAPAYANLGALYIFRKQYQQAVPVLKNALALGAKNLNRAYVLWWNLGDAYSALGSIPGAQDAYQHSSDVLDQLLAREPDRADFLSAMAVISAKLRRPERAHSEIARALHTAPDNNKVLYRAALVYELSGERTMAIAAVKQALQAGYPRAEVATDPVMSNLLKDPRARF